MESQRAKTPSNRSAGILLHPTSLPGPYGIGDLGPTAYVWVDALARAGQTWWQVLPLGPTGYGDSPYQSFSAFAGNPNLISPDLLLRDGLIRQSDLANVHFPAGQVDYGNMIPFKTWLTERAWQTFRSGGAAQLQRAFEDFSARHIHWLEDYALFMALKEAHNGKGWLEWPAELTLRDRDDVARARQTHADAVGRHQFRQFLFFRQWADLKSYAHERGVRLIGDQPIFVSIDSADVWANPELFQLDARRRPTVVAGVPPDYFSSTGQLWGNPLFDWDALKRTGYAWWIARLRSTLALVDLVRLDHFRGFEAYWEVPAGQATAERGRWVKGPGSDLFAALKQALNGLPLLAEDLGLITPEVEALRDEWHLPGMRVLQFAFGDGPKNPFLPHHYIRNTVVYTGTHDNDTTRGWYANLSQKEADFLRPYVRPTDDITWDLIRLAWSSTADYAIVPLQDVLSLGSESRMNFPGRAAGNWCWRYTPGLPLQAALDRLAELTNLFDRRPRADR